MSTAYGTRPSDLIGITGEARRFMFDNAVFAFGTALKNELANVEGKNAKDIEKKSQRVIDRWLGTEGPKRYKDPARKAL
jgi:hypothetical protein